MNGIFFALLGASIATALAGVGSARGVGSAAQAAMGVLSEAHQNSVKCSFSHFSRVLRDFTDLS